MIGGSGLSSHAAMRSARLLLALLAALALASCGDDEPGQEAAATPAPAAQSTAEPAPAEDPVEPSAGGGASPRSRSTRATGR